MQRLTLADLAEDLRRRAPLSEPPPVLLVGAGASAEAGISTTRHLMPAFNCSTWEEFQALIARQTRRERFRKLFEHLQSQDPLTITSGYAALGRLVAERHFDLLLSTNFDPLLEDALVAANMRRRDYILVVNGFVRVDRLDLLIGNRLPRVKIVKLHGDLFHYEMAWTTEEMQQFLTDIGPAMGTALKGRDLVVVGHSLADSPKIVELTEGVLADDGAVWFVNISDPPARFAEHDNVRALVGDEYRFERFFPALVEALQVPRLPPLARAIERAAGPAPTHDAVQNADDLAACVVGIAAVPGGMANATGFLLRDPRVVVSDGLVGSGFAYRAVGARDMVELATSDGRRLRARILGQIPGHPHGPWLIEVPPELRSNGLTADPALLPAGARVRVAIAAGKATPGVGVTSGVVMTGREETIAVNPLPKPVRHVVRMACELRDVGPGSSGAPVVDENFSLRGFIVAGNQDHTEAYYYPSGRWLHRVAAARGPSPVPPRRGTSKKPAAARRQGRRTRSRR